MATGIFAHPGFGSVIDTSYKVYKLLCIAEYDFLIEMEYFYEQDILILNDIVGTAHLG